MAYAEEQKDDHRKGAYQQPRHSEPLVSLDDAQSDDENRIDHHRHGGPCPSQRGALGLQSAIRCGHGFSSTKAAVIRPEMTTAVASSGRRRERGSDREWRIAISYALHCR